MDYEGCCAEPSPRNRFRFCARPKGHEGDHRNDTDTWTPGEARAQDALRRYTANLCPNCGIPSDFVNALCRAHGRR